MGNQHSLVQQSPAKRSYLQIQVDHTESDKITAATFFFCPCKRPFPSSSESVQQTRVDQSGIAREYQKIRWSERILDDPSLDRTVLSAASPQWLHKNRLCRWSSVGQKRSMIPSRSFMSESVTQMLTKKIQWQSNSLKSGSPNHSSETWKLLTSPPSSSISLQSSSSTSPRLWSSSSWSSSARWRGLTWRPVGEGWSSLMREKENGVKELSGL